MKSQLHNCYVCAEIPDPFYAPFWLPVPSLWTPVGLLVDSVGFLMVSFSVLAPSVCPFSPGCKAPLNVWLWVSSLVSISCWAKPLRWKICSTPVCKNSRIIGWAPSHAMGLKLGQSWIESSIIKVALSFTPYIFIGRTNCESKVCDWVDIPNHLLADLHGYRKRPVHW